MRFARYITSVAVRGWPLLLVLAMWLFIFWPMLVGKTVVGFRDSAYLYYPLFKWIDAQWAAGEIPLWNPYCNFGYPLVADGTSSVFYPGKLIFFCRFLSYPCRYGIYIAVHVPIAAMGAYWCARRMRAGKPGATLAAISYGFGGSVLFQTVNVVYLISAAWLPFALCCVWRMYRERSFTPAVLAGFFCSLMILGGDPQMVYMVGLIATATWLGKFRRVRKRFLRSKGHAREALPKPYRWLVVFGGKLGVMILVTSFLAAIQILPTYYWAKQSIRNNPDNIENIYNAVGRFLEGTEWPERVLDTNKGRWVELKPEESALAQALLLIGPPRRGTQYEESFQFSQPPWSILEMVWPNFFGKPFPINQRWGDQIPGADRVWTPSIYVGFLTITLGVMGFSFCCRRRSNIWLTRLCLFFAISSLGWYGVGWIVNELNALSSVKPSGIGSPVGGLYWLMVMVLPKFYMFRYPAKLFVIASLALSLLAAKTMSREKQLGRNGHTGKALMFVLGLSLVVSVLVAFYNFDTGILDSVRAPDPLFGGVDLKLARYSALLSIAQTLVVGLALLAIVSLVRSPRCRAGLLLSVVAVELIVANQWLVPQANTDSFEKTLVDVPRTSGYFAPTFAGQNGFPVEWSNSSSEQRLDEIILWQRENFYGKHHLELGCRRLGSFASIEPENARRFAELSGGDLRRAKDLPNCWFVRGNVNFNELDYRWDAAGLFNSVLRDTHLVEGKLESKSCNQFRIVVKVPSSGNIVANAAADNGWKVAVRGQSNSELIEDAEFAFSDLLVGARVPKGNVEVIFTYSPIEFWVGMWISIVSWLLLIVYMFVRIGRKPAAAARC